MAMVSKLAIFTNILLASVVLAVPSSSSRLENRLVRRRENRQSMPINRTDTPRADYATLNTVYTHNWAGAVLSKSAGTFTTVTGTFTVPIPIGSSGSAAVWVGIDGDTCGNAILQTGIDFTISSGSVSYHAWFEWYPEYAYDFDKLIISAGDQIVTTVTATSTTSGIVVIENLTSREMVTQYISSYYSLCQQDAEWIVEDYKSDGAYVPFGNFDMVEFTGATASGSNGSSYTPNGSTITDIRQNGTILTSVSISGETITVSYV